VSTKKEKENMSKKNKQTNNRDELRNTKYPISTPEVANMDEIGYYPDDLLADRISRLESERSRLLEMKFDPQPWEVELAYLYREKQLRNVRLERQEAYIRSSLLRDMDDEVTLSPLGRPVSSSRLVN
jgi:hypothetical protein